MVDTTADDTSLTACTAADNDCSLHGAILDAEALPASTISFASSVTGTITLQHDLPKLTEGEYIKGPGADSLTIGANHRPGFYAETSFAAVTISGLTVTGATGSSPAFYSMGVGANSLYLAGVRATGGGGPFTPAVVTYGPLSVYASTISGNTGKGIVANAPETTIWNSTVTGNTQGVYMLNGGEVENSTISANQGEGIHLQSGQLHLDSSIVSGNTGSDLNSGGTVLEHFSLVQNASGFTPAVGSDQNLNGQDPELGALAGNGGPTPTMKPSTSSPVIDQGHDTGGSGKDQRGVLLSDDPDVANASDGRDIGAFELGRPIVTSVSPGSGHTGDTVTITGSNFSQATYVSFGPRIRFPGGGGFTIDNDHQITVQAPPGSGTVDVTVANSDGPSRTRNAAKFTYPDPATFEVDTTADDTSKSACTAAADDCSLYGALISAYYLPGSTVTFAPTVTGTVTLTSSLPKVGSGTRLKGPGASALTIDGGQASYGYALQTKPEYGPVSVSGLTLTSSSSPAVRTGGSSPLNPTTLSDTVVSGATGNSGIVVGGPLVLERSTVTGNSVGVSNGLGYGLTIRNSTIAGNTQAGVTTSYETTVQNSTIAANGGVGLYAYGSGSLRLNSTIVAGNTGGDVMTLGAAKVTENFSLVQNATGLTLEPGSGNNLNGQNPGLGALADNGGPTKTMKPSVSGPVIDAGKDFAGTGKDQRGVALADSSVANAADGRDIGAVESAPPQVSSLSPDHGPAGTSVTISGANFGGASAVKFGTTDAASFSVVAGTVTAVAPVGSGTVDVTVTGPDGTGATGAGDKFTYTAGGGGGGGGGASQDPTDAEVQKKLMQGVLSAHFVEKKKALVFGDRLPEAGKASYTLRVAHRRKHQTKQLSLGTGTVTVTGAKTAKVTIHLGKKRWLTLRRNPKGKLSLRTGFKRALNGHVLKTTRPIKPKHRPKH